MATPQAITPEGVAKHVQALVGINVIAKKLPSQELKGPQVTAKIDDDAGTLAALIVCDIAGAGSTGGALSRIPAGAVQDLIRRNQLLDEDLLANYHEVANVITVLTTAATGRRTVLQTVDQTRLALDAALQSFIKNAKQKVYLQIAVQGYPPGGMNIFL